MTSLSTDSVLDRSIRNVIVDEVDVSLLPDEEIGLLTQPVEPARWLAWAVRAASSGPRQCVRRDRQPPLVHGPHQPTRCGTDQSSLIGRHVLNSIAEFADFCVAVGKMVPLGGCWPFGE
ncbi:MAG: hypothetical protein ACKV2O_06025 [Acidimicrobiales bacterium]